MHLGGWNILSCLYWRNCCLKDEPAQEAEKSGEGVRAVERALAILLAFSKKDDELSAAELAKRTKLSRPTLYRLLHSLEKQNFIRSVGEPQRFRLGPAVAKLALVWSSTFKIAEVAQPVMRKIWRETGETVALFVPQGAHRLCVAEIPSAEPLSFKRGVGYSELISLGASGRAILAFAESGQDTLQAYAQQSGVEVENLLHELSLVRDSGYAYSRNELIEGATAVAAPFFNGSGEVAGSIAIFGPAARINEEKIKVHGQLLKEASAGLSHELGCDRVPLAVSS
jgi:IclR family acetate operon transcriptional repressor